MGDTVVQGGRVTGWDAAVLHRGSAVPENPWSPTGATLVTGAGCLAAATRNGGSLGIRANHSVSPPHSSQQVALHRGHPCLHSTVLGRQSRIAG